MRKLKQVALLSLVAIMMVPFVAPNSRVEASTPRVLWQEQFEDEAGAAPSGWVSGGFDSSMTVDTENISGVTDGYALKFNETVAGSVDRTYTYTLPSYTLDSDDNTSIHFDLKKGANPGRTIVQILDGNAAVMADVGISNQMYVNFVEGANKHLLLPSGTDETVDYTANKWYTFTLTIHPANTVDVLVEWDTASAGHKSLTYTTDIQPNTAGRAASFRMSMAADFQTNVWLDNISAVKGTLPPSRQLLSSEPFDNETPGQLDSSWSTSGFDSPAAVHTNWVNVPGDTDGTALEFTASGTSTVDREATYSFPAYSLIGGENTYVHFDFRKGANPAQTMAEILDGSGNVMADVGMTNQLWINLSNNDDKHLMLPSGSDEIVDYTVSRWYSCTLTIHPDNTLDVTVEWDTSAGHKRATYSSSILTATAGPAAALRLHMASDFQTNVWLDNIALAKGAAPPPSWDALALQRFEDKDVSYDPCSADWSCANFAVPNTGTVSGSVDDPVDHDGKALKFDANVSTVERTAEYHIPSYTLNDGDNTYIHFDMKKGGSPGQSIVRIADGNGQTMADVGISNQMYVNFYIGQDKYLLLPSGSDETVDYTPNKWYSITMTLHSSHLLEVGVEWDTAVGRMSLTYSEWLQTGAAAPIGSLQLSMADDFQYNIWLDNISVTVGKDAPLSYDLQSQQRFEDGKQFGEDGSVAGWALDGFGANSAAGDMDASQDNSITGTDGYALKLHAQTTTDDPRTASYTLPSYTLDAAENSYIRFAIRKNAIPAQTIVQILDGNGSEMADVGMTNQMFINFNDPNTKHILLPAGSDETTNYTANKWYMCTLTIHPDNTLDALVEWDTSAGHQSATYTTATQTTAAPAKTFRLFMDHDFTTNVWLDNVELAKGAAAPPSWSMQPAAAGFSFGINAGFNNIEVKKMIADTVQYSTYGNLFSQYQVDTMRYPGGSPVRFYFWEDDENKLWANEAIDKLHDFGQRVILGPNEKGRFETLQHQITKAGNYDQYLNLMAATGQRPLIQLNTAFYHDGNNIYAVEGFKKDGNGDHIFADDPHDWATIQAGIEAQMDHTHAIVPGSVTWEIGNEDYVIYDPEQYADIAMRYTNIVKAKYPGDKVAVTLLTFTDKAPYWNPVMVDYLDQHGMLPKIDYFVPHIYYQVDQIFSTDQNIINRVNASFLSDTMDTLKGAFPTTYSPEFWITEFTVLKNKVAGNNYNTQLHAMLLWDQLLKFHGDPSIKKVTKHALAEKSNGLFFDSNISSTFPYVDPQRHDSEIYAYIPPHADTERIFNESTGEELVNYSLTGQYEQLVTRTGTSTHNQILNYTASGQTVDLSSYNGEAYTTYTLPDLTDHYWDADSNKTTGTVTGSVYLPAHSFTYVISGN